MAIKAFSLDIRRLFSLALLVLAISVLILDNYFLYNSIIKLRPYLQLRTTVRSLKSDIGLEYEFTKYYETLKEYDPKSEKKSTNLGYAIHSTYYDDLKEIIGRNRLKQMKRFHDIYRNSSKFSNEVILGDLIHEYIGGRIDTLNVPLEKATTRLSWFIYPVILNANQNYKFELSEVQYKSIRGNVITIEGSDESLINIYALDGENHKENYYLFSCENKLFVYPTSAIPKEWLYIN